MSKYYCLHCGSATDYSYNIPKFCSFCGEPTGKSVASSSFSEKKKEEPKKHLRYKEEEEEEDDDEDNDVDFDDEIEFENLKGLQVEVYASRPPAEKFGEVAKQEKTGISIPRAKYTKKQFEREFLKPKNARQNPINIGNE